MKKSISMITALALAGALGVSNLAVCASAAGINGTDSNSAEVTLTYSVAEGYTITIPTDPLTIEASGTPLTVSAQNILLTQGNTLSLTVSGGANGFQMYTAQDTGKTNGLTYEVKDADTAITNDGEVLSVAAGGTGVEKELNINVTGTPTYAGNYTGTLTFTATVAPTT